MEEVQVYSGGKFSSSEAEVVAEFPLVLRVNDREIVTLIASPHDLRFLVAGFLRVQGFVQSVSDFEMFSVCNDYGIANVRIKGELPQELKPILTSGCGTGITFTLPAAGSAPAKAASTEQIKATSVFALMDELTRKAEKYKRHGGVHSAAVGDTEGNLLLYAEDIGRHNTVDRIAGEALLKEVDLTGKLMITSGRISAEMASKAASLGIHLIASRTSPTDLAIRICKEANIILIGYLRGKRFNIYAHSELVAPEAVVPSS